MASNNFDPTKYGATPFDPTALGATPVEQPKSGFVGGLGKVGKFLGDVTGVNAIVGASKDILLEGKGLKETLPKAVGGAAKLGLTIGTLGSATPATVGGRVLLGATEGAGYGLAESIEKEKGLKDTAIQTAVGGALGGAIPITFEALEQGGKVLLPKIAKQLEKTNLRLTPVDKRNYASKLDDVANFLRKEKIVGTPESRFLKVDKIYEGKEEALGAFLKKDLANRTISKESVVKQLNNVKRQFANERDVIAIQKQIDGLVETIQTRYPSNIPAWKLNNLKRSTYSNAFNKAGDKVLDDVEFAMGDRLRHIVELIAKGGNVKNAQKLIGGKTLQEFNREYGTIITARKLLKTASSRNQLGAFGRLISTIFGASVGGATGGPIGVGVGAWAGEHFGKMIAGTPTRSAIGAAAQKLSETSIKKIAEPVRRTITPIISR